MIIPNYAIPLIAGLFLLTIAIILGISSLTSLLKKRKDLHKNLIITLVTTSIFQFGFSVICIVASFSRFEIWFVSSAIIIGGFVIPSIYLILKWFKEENIKCKKKQSPTVSR